MENDRRSAICVLAPHRLGKIGSCAIESQPVGGAAQEATGFGRPEILGNSRYLDWARDQLRLRRRRSEMFSPDLWADAAWDITLELYASYYEGRSISLRQVSESAGIPEKTAIRWVDILQSRGIAQVTSPSGRTDEETWLCLTRDAIVSVNDIIDDATAIAPTITDIDDRAIG